jgi:hypothetical protein
VEGDISINSETLWVIDFVNLKIKPAQSFKYAYKDIVYVRVFIGVSTYTYINIYAYIIFIKKLR